LSGYQTPGYYTYQCVIVPLEGDPVMFTRYLEETNVRGLSWIDTRAYYNDNQDPVEETLRALREHGLADKTIGVEENSWFLTVTDYRKLQEGLPGATFKDASGTVEQLRLIKSDQEIAYIREAAAACDEGVRRAIEVAAPGASENDLALALYAGSLEHDSEYMSLPPFVASGYRSALAHATWSGRELVPGEVVFVEHAGVIHRYSAALIRTLSVGEPSDQVKRMDEAARAGLAAAIATSAPGVPAYEVDRACRGAIRDLGFGDYFRHRTGYSIGINFPPDWGEGHIMSIKESESRPLEAGMTFHFVPGLFDYGHAAVGCSQTVLITENGCEPLSTIPPQLFVV
ncbi:MAG: aminopeptidase P family protein, partial [Thermomicrobiales bacterium]|nr:aminopeptidase P family protein [Thermomicrobiales bacterium]